MDNCLINKFTKLPDVLIHIILDYSDIIIFRHGKYMNRINKNDNRYKNIQNISKPIKIMENKILLKLLNYKYSEPIGYLLEYTFYNTYNIIKVNFVIRRKIYNDKYYDITKCNKYIFNINSKYSKLVDYSL